MSNQIQFVYQPNTNQAIPALSNRLVNELKAERSVAWFLCGGSNIPLCVQAMERIPSELSKRLTVLLTDERFGKPGHPDSNWKQLYDAGFEPKQARVIETLQHELTLENTCQTYEQAVREAATNSEVVIAQFGIGGDGHIAGMLPHSVAVTNERWVIGYDAGAFVRITITPPVWEHIDAAYAFVYGSTKYGTLKRLKDEALSVVDQPAQLLKTLPEAYIYTDQKL